MTRNSISLFVLVVACAVALPSCELFRPVVTDASEDRPKVDKPVPSRKSDANTAVLRQNIIQDSRTHIGTKYKYAGKTPKTGFDCSGFTAYAYAEHGHTISSSSKAQASTGRAIPLHTVEPGDLIFFSQDGRNISHVAMVTRRDNEGIWVIHSTTSRGVMEQNITSSEYWRPKILFARDVLSYR